MCSGQLLCTFHFDSGIASVVMDNTETRLFAGANNGAIYQVNLFEKVRSVFLSKEKGKVVFLRQAKSRVQQRTCQRGGIHLHL